VERVTIIGTGLIGGSIGLALRAAKLSGLEVVGYDRENGAMGDARRMGAIDRGAPTLAEAVRDARMVIAAVPPLALRQVFEEIAPHLAEGAIVTDTTSTKAMAARWAKELLPEHISFIGGHPMAGKETQGIKHAEAGLFKDKTWVVVPSPDAGEGAVRSVLGLINILGAEPLFIDAEEHDQYVAAVSHLPLVMSTALFSLVRNSPSWDDIAPLAASGFRDVTRLASGEPRMAHDICVTNGDAIAHWIDRYIVELQRFRDLMLVNREASPYTDPVPVPEAVQKENSKALFRAFAEAQLQRDTFMSGERPSRQPRVELPSSKETMSSMIFGGLISSRMEQFDKEMSGDRKNRRRSVLDDDDN
jgi:prephenate dehydrogenase